MSNPAADLAAMRCKVSHTCPVCGASFVGLKTARTCSNRCRQVLKRAKRREKETGFRPAPVSAEEK